MKMKSVALIVVPLIFVAAVVAAVTIRNRVSNDANAIKVSGNIEVIAAEVSFKIPGRVIERTVDEGDIVAMGQTIARLEDADLAHRVDLAKAQVAAAEAVLAQLVAGSRPEEIAQAQAAAAKAKAAHDEAVAGSRPQQIAAAEAAVASARATLENLKAEFDRQAELYRKAVTSQGEYDTARTAYEAGKAALDEAEQNFKLIQEGSRKEDIEQARAGSAEADQALALVVKGPRQETIDNARAQVDAAKAALALAQTQLGYATVAAPLSGVVLSKNIEPGEYVAPGTPVVTVGDLVNVYLRAYINETDLACVKVGQRVLITTDSYPGKTYEGRVTFIASQAEFTPKNVQTAKERVKLVYRIKASVTNPSMELKAGMPADGLVMLQ
jgi:HlyD family secretion protein